MSSERTIKVRDQKPGEVCRMYDIPIRTPQESALLIAKAHFGEGVVLVHVPNITIRVYAVEKVPEFGVAMKDETPKEPPHV